MEGTQRLLENPAALRSFLEECSFAALPKERNAALQDSPAAAVFPPLLPSRGCRAKKIKPDKGAGSAPCPYIKGNWNDEEIIGAMAA